MIKLVYVITRRADKTPAQFYDYWLGAHAPLVATHQGALRMRKYVQSHLVDTPANEAMRAVRGMQAPVDGVTEVWWDSLEDMQRAYAAPEGARAGQDLSEDESRFIDRARSQVFITTEHEIFDHAGGAADPSALKVTYLLTRREDLTQEACHKTWLADHGPLVTSFSRTLNMRRYVQSHTIAPEMNAAMTTSGGFAAPLDGITEVWINSAPSVDPASGEAQAAASLALVEDERRFVKMGASRCFMTREHEIFASSP